MNTTGSWKSRRGGTLGFWENSWGCHKINGRVPYFRLQLHFYDQMFQTYPHPLCVAMPRSDPLCQILQDFNIFQSIDNYVISAHLNLIHQSNLTSKWLTDLFLLRGSLIGSPLLDALRLSIFNFLILLSLISSWQIWIWCINLTWPQNVKLTFSDCVDPWSDRFCQILRDPDPTRSSSFQSDRNPEMGKSVVDRIIFLLKQFKI